MISRLRHLRDVWRMHRRQVLARRALSQHPRPLKLHIGCGQVHFPGWVHLDENRVLPHLDAVWHANDPLPCEDGSCEFIYSEHFLEHLTVEQSRFFLRQCHRALRPGGVVRIAMPDMADCLRHYVDGNWQQQPWLEKYGYTWIRTGCEYVNVTFREWGHQWLYDHEELRRRLSEAGFQNIRDAASQQSESPELRNRETRLESVLICEATR
jgi:predicted SAM-dependent methyltransferase